MPTRLIVLAAMIAALALPAAATAAPSKNLVETAASKPRFSTLVSLVKKAGLVGVLSGKTNYTVFAPTNAAFKKVPSETLDELAKNKSMLKSVLLYHVLPGKVPASKVSKTKSAKTAEGSKVTFSVRGDSAFVNEAKIIKTDVRCSNGIIHAINGVLLPPGS